MTCPNGYGPCYPGQCINDATQTCCGLANGNQYDVIACDRTQSCCGLNCIDPSTQKCCPTGQWIGSEVQPGIPYNPETQACCGGTVINLATQICCGEKNICPNNGDCCGSYCPCSEFEFCEGSRCCDGVDC